MLKRIINECFLRDHDSVRKVAMLDYSRALHNTLYIKFRILLARESLFTRGKSFSRRNEVLDKLIVQNCVYTLFVPIFHRDLLRRGKVYITRRLNPRVTSISCQTNYWRSEIVRRTIIQSES